MISFSHLDAPETEGSKLKSGGYYCPQCCSKYCELPVECKACGLTLVSAPHLARSYHHLFPVENFVELEYKDVQDGITLCYACQKKFGEHDKHVSNLITNFIKSLIICYHMEKKSNEVWIT
jgi:transcription factor ssl1